MLSRAWPLVFAADIARSKRARWLRCCDGV